jgi:predicted nucleic acid-binding protein
MKLLIDTNVVLDVLLNRQPFCEDAAKVLKLVARRNIEEYISASAITDIYYIANKMIRDKTKVRKLIEQLLKVVKIAAVSSEEINKALELKWNDFEDSVQYSVALLADMDGIITRNTSDYIDSDINIWTPKEFLNLDILENNH